MAAPRTYTIPKAGGGVRVMTELGQPDAERWDALARQTCLRIERSLGPEVLGNRFSIEDGRLQPFVPALRSARAAARRLSTGADATLRTDVRAFYPSVTPSLVNRSLTRVGVERSAAAAAAALMTRWETHDVAGLPIGPPPSAVFANAVLTVVDAALRARNLPFVRWVDDYLIGLRGQEPADVLDMLDTTLAGMGLARAPGKTIVGSGPVTNWLGRDYASGGRTIAG